ncbi:cytochrome c biogenesis heme-transporting ATPase CcmA [Aquabacterium sp. A7-Y]|uniref:cytochrome c biogenesis heme-transporting ATPase CcmA n=1 Tax=Aquabacterium sp. A7-Y TaxID=1349605 RepID=UPI00223E1396|nr:cytochrome c biogenesis heme-transporting ATPase CcmA [Aquabacterium sp. A7-Y]MCW7538576.1 cytochrome c biogenesis heme-transporting ATPase CcmA [Aquabacterium sp. A7-Y]
MPSAEAPRLALVKLACRRGGSRLFQDLDLEVRPGELVWVRGRNGCGKTSLLRLAAGLASPESGQVLWGGLPVRQAAGRVRPPVWLGHADALNDDLSVSEALQFLLRLQARASDAASVHQALERMGLQGRRHARVGSLSQGQRRRVALARLAADPGAGLWLLDEPFDALDAEAIERLVGLLGEQLQRGGSVVLSSHQGVDLAALRPRGLDLDRRHPAH